MDLDTDVLKRAYLTPLTNPWAALRIFWPFMLLFGIGSQLQTLSTSVPSLGGWGFIFLGPALMLAAWPMFAAGAIRWHRWLVLDEPAAALSLSIGKRLWGYFGRTVALAGISLAVLLIMAAFAFVPFLFSSSPSPEDSILSTRLTFLVCGAFLMVDVLIAAFLARFVLGLPIVAVENHSQAFLRGFGQPQRGVRTTLLAATLPLTGFYCLMAFGMPKFTPDASDDPDFVMPAWAVGVDCFNTAMLDLLFFYTALVFLSALSFWYAKHERARLLAAAPA